MENKVNSVLRYIPDDGITSGFLGKDREWGDISNQFAAAHGGGEAMEHELQRMTEHIVAKYCKCIVANHIWNDYQVRSRVMNILMRSDPRKPARTSFCPAADLEGDLARVISLSILPWEVFRKAGRFMAAMSDGDSRVTEAAFYLRNKVLHIDPVQHTWKEAATIVSS